MSLPSATLRSSASSVASTSAPAGTSAVAPPVSVVQTKPTTQAAQSTASEPVSSSASSPPAVTSSASPSPSPSSSSSSSLSSSPPTTSASSSSSLPSSHSSSATSTSEILVSYVSSTAVSEAPSATLALESAPSEVQSQPAGQIAFSKTNTIAVIVGGAVFVFLLIGFCWFFAHQRRRNKRKNAIPRLEDDVIGRWRPRSDRLSRAGWRRSLDREPKELAPQEVTPYPLPERRGHEITHGEARDSVRMEHAYGNSTLGRGPSPLPPLPTNAMSRSELFVPPSRTHPAFSYPASERSSVWADNSEADMYVNDGSTIARTISTVTRPNSEYDLEADPGATFHHHGGGLPLHMAPHAPQQQPLYDHDFASAHAFGPAGSHNSAGTFGSMSGMMASAATAYAPSPSAYAPAHSTHGAQGRFYPATGSQSRGSGTYMSGSTSLASPVSASSPLSPHGPSHATAAQGFYDVNRQLAPMPSDSGASRRIPAPRLLVDIKAAIAWPNDTLSAGSAQPSTGPSWNPQSSTSLIPNAAPPGATLSERVLSPSAAQRSPDLPYSTSVPGPAPSDPAVLAAVAAQPGAGLRRGQTIVRHADGGAFDDVVPDNDSEAGTLHLPPAYGDIYGPPAPR